MLDVSNGGGESDAILSVRSVAKSFGGVQAVKEVSLDVERGSIFSIIGPNGAGKTSLVNMISGFYKADQGSITFDGTELIGNLTGDENLIAGGHIEPSVAEMNARKDLVYTYFPRLKERRHIRSGYYSGGEQQMLAIGRALMSNPKMVLLDEPSLGLAPMIVEEIFGIIRRLNQEQGVTILLVEQNASLALEYADYGYVMENGSIVMEGEAESLRTNSDVQEFYLGMSEGGERKSYRDVKQYRRRKRWLS